MEYRQNLNANGIMRALEEKLDLREIRLPEWRDGEISFSGKSNYSLPDILHLHNALQYFPIGLKGGEITATTKKCYLPDFDGVDMGDEDVLKMKKTIKNINDIKEKLSSYSIINPIPSPRDEQQNIELKNKLSEEIENLTKMEFKKTWGSGGEIKRSALELDFPNPYGLNLPYVRYIFKIRGSQELCELLTCSKGAEDLFNKYFHNNIKLQSRQVKLEDPNILILEHNGRVFLRIGTSASVGEKEFIDFLELLMFRSP